MSNWVNTSESRSFRHSHPALSRADSHTARMKRDGSGSTPSVSGPSVAVSLSFLRVNDEYKSTAAKRTFSGQVGLQTRPTKSPITGDASKKLQACFISAKGEVHCRCKGGHKENGDSSSVRRRGDAHEPTACVAR